MTLMYVFVELMANKFINKLLWFITNSARFTTSVT